MSAQMLGNYELHLLRRDYERACRSLNVTASPLAGQLFEHIDAMGDRVDSLEAQVRSLEAELLEARGEAMAPRA